MARFSERYGYVTPSNTIIRETITIDINNAICNTLMEVPTIDFEMYCTLEKHLWLYYFNYLASNFTIGYLIQLINRGTLEWYKKLDLIEEIIGCLRNMSEEPNDTADKMCGKLVESLNWEFKRLNFAYRIVDDLIVEITSEEEIASIQQALDISQNGVKTHLHTALVHLSTKPVGDYRNSIKESISAVEAITREITGENSINFKKIEEAGVFVPIVLRDSFLKLYGYTNDKTTGIRHALMDDTNAPTADEAIFMLVSCSAFINYLTKKISNK
ncbi:MAG: hypothetical protein LIR40_06460 [Bacteroidota bacterium]|nr:hypothetical protein [Bacteroidota bacterium]